MVDLDPGELGIDITSSAGGSGTPVISLLGEIDASTSARLHACFAAVAAGRPGTITVDLGGVRFMDSSGINALVDLQRRAAAWDGHVVVIDVPANVRRVFDVSGVGVDGSIDLR